MAVDRTVYMAIRHSTCIGNYNILTHDGLSVICCPIRGFIQVIGWESYTYMYLRTCVLLERVVVHHTHFTHKTMFAWRVSWSSIQTFCKVGYFFSIHLKQKVYQHDSIIAKPTFLVNSGLQLANGVYWPMAPSNTRLILLLTCNSKKPIYCALLQEYPHTTTHFALFMTTKRIDKLYHIDSNQKCSTHTNCLPLLRTTHTHTHKVI